MREDEQVVRRVATNCTVVQDVIGACPSRRRLSTGLVICSSAAIGCLVASFLPWASSGVRLRDSYELVAVAGRLDLVPEALAGPSRAWSLLPLCSVFTCAAVIFRCAWLLAMFSLIVGAASVGLAIVVFRSPLGTELGAQVAVVTGLLSVVGVPIVVVEQRRPS